MTATKTVGLIHSGKKLAQIRFDLLQEMASASNIRLILLDLGKPLEDQGPIDLMVHKVTDLYAKMLRGDKEAEVRFKRFQIFCSENPHIPVIDRWENIEHVLDRAKISARLEACAVDATGERLFNVPKAITLDNLYDPAINSLEIPFPLICKRKSACSSVEAHQMTLIPSRQAMADVQGFGPKEPVILQQFIPHDGVLVKVYVIDGTPHVSTRPSLKNIPRENQDKAIPFDSQKLPKAFGQASQDVAIASDLGVEQRAIESRIDLERIQKITNRLHRELGLTLFGFDVLLESATGAYYIVDVNYFPSFRDVPDYPCIFAKLIKKDRAAT